MNKKEIFDELMKLDHADRVDLVGAVAAEFTAEEITTIVSKKAPAWASSSLGKVVLGTVTALAGLVAGYFINKVDTQQLPAPTTDVPAEVQHVE